MASICDDGNGLKRILFVGIDGKRRAVRIGKASMKQAEAFKVKIENLVGGGYSGSIDDETSRWLAALPDKLHARLAAVGLVKARAAAQVVGLGAFIDAFLAGRPDYKDFTKINFAQVKRWLVDCFGAGKDIRSITSADGEGFRQQDRRRTRGKQYPPEHRTRPPVVQSRDSARFVSGE